MEDQTDSKNVLSESGANDLSFILLAAATTVLLLSSWYNRRPSGIPPGPRGLPIFGYLPWLGKKPYLTFNKIAAKYESPIFSLYLGNQLVIVLNNYEAINAALVKQANNFSGRHKSNSFNVDKNLSLLANDGQLWAQHRQFMLSHLRDLGLGKSNLEPQILNEIGYFLNELKSYEGRPTDFRDLLGMTVSNNICILEFGKRFEYTDTNFLAMKQSVDVFLAATNSISPLAFLPWARPFTKFFGSEALKTITRHLTDFQARMCRLVEGQKVNHKSEDKDSYVDLYLTEQKTQNSSKREDTYFTEEIMYHNLRMLFIAGTETTSVTMLWGLIYMMKYPDVQRKVQAELDSVIGRDRLPSYNDCARTPYTEATIFEIERTASLLPLNLPHRNIKECQVLGYTIPKDSYIVTNLWNVHHDQELWDEPFRFNPERFLTEENKTLRPPYLIPFSIGKRECLGKPLAKMELYLYFASLLQAFTFQAPDDNSPNMNSRMGITIVPTEFLACAIPR